MHKFTKKIEIIANFAASKFITNQYHIHYTMKKNFLTVLGASALMVSLWGCVDDDYDLSDIDKTVRVSVNDLVVPINMDAITLSTIFDLEDDSRIKDLGDMYALVDTGSFHSEAINIPDIDIAAPSVPATTVKLTLPEFSLPSLPGGITVSQQLIDRYGSLSALLTNYGLKVNDRISVSVTDLLSQFNYSYTGFSGHIVKVDRVGTDLTIGVSLSLEGLPASACKSINIKGLKLKFPAGLETDDKAYDPATGILTIGDVKLGAVNSYSLNVKAINENGSTIKFDYGKRSISFSDRVGVAAGTVEIVYDIDGLNVSAPNLGLPSYVTMKSDPSLSALKVLDFTGQVAYGLGNIGIDPIELNDLPDVLTGSNTDIRVANPQVYLTFKAPKSVNDAKVFVRSGVNVSAVRQNEPVARFGIDAFYVGPFNDASTGINYPWQADGVYRLCLSPVKPERYYEGFSQAVHVPYPGLGNVLSGAGLPQSLDIELQNPELPVQQVAKFALGNLGTVDGKYTMFVPLAIGSGSMVEYSDVVDGWGSEDLDDMTIERAQVMFTLTSTLPLSVELTGEALDTNGNPVGTFDATTIPANAKDREITIGLTGEIRNLDGIRFTARAVADNPDGKALSPNEKIMLSNIKVRVSGYYETVLGDDDEQ